MNKTSRERNLPLHPVSAVIAAKYGYKFPINPPITDKRINDKNALFNKFLRKACEAAGVPSVSYHTARHSIADLMVKKKRSSKQIQGVLGHGKLATTEVYLKSFYLEETDTGLEDLFN